MFFVLFRKTPKVIQYYHGVTSKTRTHVPLSSYSASPTKRKIHLSLRTNTDVSERAAQAGFEPANVAVKVLCLAAWRLGYKTRR